jgi:hypothetical protein
MHALSRNLSAGGLVGAMLTIALAPYSSAISITVEYDPTQPGAVSPAFDPNGTQLIAIANYVASYYEDVFEDAGHSPTFTFWYTDLADGLLGDHDNITDDGNNREIEGNIKIDTQNAAGIARSYFFDLTPETNGEFTMAQLLWRDLSVTNRADWYAGAASVPPTFETSYTGTAPIGSPAAGANDILSLVFHEMGHALGMSSGIPLAVTETNDGDYDFNSAFLFGGTLAADNRDQANDFLGHLDDPSSLMFPNLSIPGSGGSVGVRKLPSHADLFAMAAGHNYSILDVPRREFYNPNGNWNTAANWSGNNVPDSADDVFIRNGATATLTEFAAAGNLNVLEGALVSTQDNTLFVQNATTVAGTAGNESQITINTGGQLDSDMLIIDGGGRVVLVSTAILESENITIADGGELRGYGTVNINSEGGELSSNGLIRATNNSELTFTSLNNLALNLDGQIEAIDGNIRFVTGLSTPLAGTMIIGPGREVVFEQGAGVGAGGLILFEGTAENPATIRGLPLGLSLNGVVRADGVGVIDNTLLLASGAILETAPGEPNAELRLAGTTVFQGGKILGDGRARQIGNATIEQDTEISIDTYDMDGIAGDTVITIHPDRTLQILSDHLDTTGNNDFGGTIHINSGTLDIAAAWRLEGTLNLNETTPTNAVLRGAGGVTVAGGGEIKINGDVDVDSSIQIDNGTLFVDGDAVFSGATTLSNNADVEIDSAEDSLRLRGQTHLISPSLVGSGRLIFDGNVHIEQLDAFVGTAETDLDGIDEETEIVINQGLLFSIASTTLEPADDDGFDGVITNHGALSVVAGWRLDGDLEMDQIGETVPSLDGLGTFHIHTTGTYITDGGSRITPPLEVAGAMVVDGGISRVSNTAMFESTAKIVVEQGAELKLNGPTTFRAGSYTGGGLLQLNAATTVDADTTIATRRVDLDGITDDTSIVLNNAALVLNVDGVGATDSLFSGTIHATGLSARLDVNLNDPTATWGIASTGTLNLTTPDAASTPPVMLDGSNVSVEGRINASGRLRLSANVALHGRLQTMTSTTDVHFASGGQNLVFNTATIDGEGDITIDNGTQLQLEDSSTVGVDVENAGRLEVGFLATEGGIEYTAAASATIRGDYSQPTSGTFAVELGGLAQADEFDVLNITGTAHLGGALEVELIDGFVPMIGDVFQILTARAVAGTFDSLITFDAAENYGFDISVLYSPTDAAVRIDDLFLLGDYNQNGAVDPADYVLWRDTLGQMGMGLAADGNLNGEIDIDDYDVWRVHFGNTAAAGAAGRAARMRVSRSLALARLPETQRLGEQPWLGGLASSVPEPPTIALACCALAGIIELRHVRCKFGRRAAAKTSLTPQGRRMNIKVHGEPRLFNQ